MHLAIRLVKGKGSFNNTVKVICYSEAPLSFGWIFYVLMILTSDLEYPGISILSAAFWIASNFYVYYIILTGISVTSGITMPRAFAALMVQLFMFAVVIAVFVSGIYLYSTNTPSSYSPTPYPTPFPTPAYENYTPPNPEKYRITAYVGSPPQIDGAVTEEDKWHEGEQFIAKDKNRTYYITIKHDFEYIYILMKWENPFKQSGNIEVFFEQDNNKQDFDLNNGRVDGYFQGYYQDDNLVIESFVVPDAHYEGDRYAGDEQQGGSLYGGYKNGKWILEWKIPMNSGDKYDIYINSYPTEVGFAITNTVAAPEGVFPPGADNHDPRTWGTMTIVDKRRQ